MSFTIFPRHAKYGHSNWNNRQVILNRSTLRAEHIPLSDTLCNDTSSSSNSDGSDSSDTLVAHTQALDFRRSLNVKLDPTLYQRLQQDAGHSTTTLTGNGVNGGGGGGGGGGDGNQRQVRKLKPSLRQVVSAPTSPQHGPRWRGSSSGKSVKFDPLHLEKVCFFEGNHSPNEVTRFEENKVPPFKIMYSHWPPIQHTLFQQQQNVQLKRSLKLLEGGSVLRGQVMVRNLGYEKHVEIRYTMDGWQSVKNVSANYSHSRGALDIFVYEIDIEQGMLDRGYLRLTLDMAVRYSVMVSSATTQSVEETFWDNNNGYNYQIQVVETVTPSPTLTAATAPSNTTIHEINGLNDDNEHFTPPPSSSSVKSTTSLSLTSSASCRYDFGQSLLQAKHHSNKPLLSSPLSSTTTSPSSSIPSSPTTTDIVTIEKKQSDKNNWPSSSSFVDNLIDYSLNRKTQSAPSSPPNSSYLLDFFNNATTTATTTNHPLASSSYSDLVNKYCFYGSQDTPSSSPALSMNG